MYTPTSTTCTQARLPRPVLLALPTQDNTSLAQHPQQPGVRALTLVAQAANSEHSDVVRIRVTSGNQSEVFRHGDEHPYEFLSSFFR